MRLNFLLLFVIIAALGVSGFFLVNYFKHAKSVDNLSEQIAISNKEIQRLRTSNQSLEAEIESIKINQASIQDAITSDNLIITTKPNSNEIIRDVMKLAGKNGTSIIPLSTSDWVKQKIIQGDYQVLKITFNIQGTEQSVINFMRGLQDLYPTLVIENIRIITSDPTYDTGTPTSSTIGRLYSRFSIALYAK